TAHTVGRSTRGALQSVETGWPIWHVARGRSSKDRKRRSERGNSVADHRSQRRVAGSTNPSTPPRSAAGQRCWDPAASPRPVGRGMVITKNSIGDTARTVFAFQAGLADTLLASASFPQYLATDVPISHVVTAQQLRAACSPR